MGEPTRAQRIEDAVRGLLICAWYENWEQDMCQTHLRTLRAALSLPTEESLAIAAAVRAYAYPESA